jgi:hypothetical protein
VNRDLTRKQLEQLYLPPADAFVEVDVPELRYFMVDGRGDPGGGAAEEATAWLWAAVHPIKREAKERMGKRFVEPPLEGLWWADDPADFVAGRRDKLVWRLMIPAPAWATEEMFAEGVDAAAARRGEPPASMRLDAYAEGRSVQIMHVGPNEEELATITRLHEDYLPAHGLLPNGPHHEIYLFDPRRTAPAKRKTVLRQPVRAADEPATAACGSPPTQPRRS